MNKVNLFYCDYHKEINSKWLEVWVLS
jgi:hypothetical protein